MIKFISSTAITGAMLVLGLTAPAQALPNRVWVSGRGADAAGCGARANPCRTFQFAHDNIAAGGEIDVADPASYGVVMIGKPLSIVNDNVGATGIPAKTAGQNGVTINALAGEAVYLRGLDIEGFGVGGNGVLLNSGGSLTIVDCVIRRFNAGIVIAPGSGATTVFISNTIVSDNTVGIALSGFIGAHITGVISQTTAANNGDNGIIIWADISGSAVVTIVDSVAYKNGVGFHAYGNGNTGGILRLGRSVATGNGTGVLINAGGTARSYGDNKIDGNGTGPAHDVVGALSPLANK